MAGMSVVNRLQIIRNRAAKACARAGRAEDAVHILAVSKGQPIEKIREAFDCGQKFFAENYVQEALGKLDQLENLPVEWHFIGRIQSNKVKQLAGHFAKIHSVDRLSIAASLDSLSSNRPQEIFLQYNVADEASKGGGNERDVEEMAEKIQSLPHVRVRGLMVMPPLLEKPEDSRPFFKKARALRDKLRLNELSMGTSADFEVAIEEGATWIRIGTEIFGERKGRDAAVDRG